MFTGSFVAIVTPFRDGAVDEQAFADLINWQIESGTDGIIPCGTTGESATLNYEEHNRVIELCVEVVNKRVPVIAGTGSNATAEAIELSQHAAKVGADAVLLVSPYYNKPTQEGLYRHHMAIADAVDIPQLLYNVPGRTAVNMTPETVARLAYHKNIVGIKDAGGDLSKTADLIAMCGENFDVISGDDALTLPMMSIGARGVISVTANVAPDKIAAMVDAFYDDDMELARKYHYEVRELTNAMFYETNPIPVKTALAIMGRIREEFRLPLCQMSQINRERLQAVIKKMELAALETTGA